MGDGRGRDVEDESWTDMEDAGPDLVEAVPIRHGMVLAGRYAIERIIGRGGSGVVVRAHDRDLKTAVAIKIVRADLAGQRVWAERLAREVRLARQIHHPHVCRVFDFQQADGRVFLVMELAEKGTLRDEIRSGVMAALPLAERIADARAVASALAAIHAAGIVHRDLTPQNLLRMGDGRLVLSDFGLAVDVADSTSSVHGGTVAYMAPEVLRGGSASAASDVWALGVVMHEIVFGVKPEWKGEAGTRMSLPALGRKATREERAVVEACRGCTAKEPTRRIATAAEAGRMLTEWRRRPLMLARRRQLTWAAVVTLLVAATVGVLRVRNKASDRPWSPTPILASPLIIPTGEPADWTDLSTVLAEVPDRITCMRRLPDRRTIRFRWGTPPRAEDVDTVTRKRVPSPLVPATYAEGCPDVSPDGKRVLFQGHRADGRPFAFLSERPDGEGAVPVVQTAEPSMSSEPTWLADGQMFSYDVDAKHVGVFLIGDSRMHVLPEGTAGSFVSMFRYAVGNRVFVTTWSDSEEMEFVGFAAPEFKNDVRFRIPQIGLDLSSAGAMLYYAGSVVDRASEIIEIDLAQSGARRIGRVRDQFVRHPIFTDPGLSFISVYDESNLFVGIASGRFTPVTSRARIRSVRHCGQDLIVSRFEANRMIIQRLDLQGRILKLVSSGPSDHSPACSPDGRIWYYTHESVGSGIRRCDDSGCSSLAALTSPSLLSVSPDGSRLAFLDFGGKAPMVKWVSVDGGNVHDVIETETGCSVGWTSSRTLWVSRRQGPMLVWTEVDVDSRRETGRTHPGSRDCSDGRQDPSSPVDPDLRIAYEQASQLRLLDTKFIRRN